MGEASAQTEAALGIRAEWGRLLVPASSYTLVVSGGAEAESEAPEHDDINGVKMRGKGRTGSGSEGRVRLVYSGC